jgi:hypothetical protein
MNVFFYPSTIKKYIKTDDGLLHCAVNIFFYSTQNDNDYFDHQKKTFYLDFLLIIRI